MKRDTSLNQFFTPTWAAELIVQHFYPDLSERDTVLEAGCGDGRFLMAVPEDVDAYGVEIDPTLIDEARHNTGREIIQGDFRKVDLPRRPTVVLGNPTKCG
jgi:site-specific DNA-methyltransferase (adenine-specific)